MFENEGGFRFKSEEDMNSHFTGMEERIKESMKNAKEKFSGEDEKWERIVEHIEKEAENETEIDDIIMSAKDIFSGLEEDCFYTLYQAILLKLQLIDEKKTYIVKKDSDE